MRGLLRPVRHGKSKHILPLPQAIRDVKVKRKVSPLMTSHPDSIDKYTALLVNGAEMKKNPAFLKTFRKSEFLSVMSAGAASRFYPRPRALDSGEKGTIIVSS